MRLTRRSFLGMAGLSGVGVGMSSSWSWTGAQPAIAVLGVGEAGLKHCAAIVAGNFGVIKAIADPMVSRALEVQRLLVAAGRNPPRVYSSAQALLEQEQPDVVVVASPDTFHMEQMRACAAKRAMVVIEPPLANDWPEWDALMQAGRNGCAGIFVASSWRIGNPHETPPPAVDGKVRPCMELRLPAMGRNDDLKLWQQSWMTGNGVLSTRGFALFDLATRDLTVAAPVRVFAVGDGSTQRGAGSTPRHLMAVSWLEDGSTVTWTEPEPRSGTTGGVTVRDAAGTVLRTVSKHNLRSVNDASEPLIGLWRSVMLDAEKDEPSIHRIGGFLSSTRLWLSVKTAIQSGRTEVFHNKSRHDYF